MTTRHAIACRCDGIPKREQFGRTHTGASQISRHADSSRPRRRHRLRQPHRIDHREHRSGSEDRSSCESVAQHRIRPTSAAYLSARPARRPPRGPRSSKPVVGTRINESAAVRRMVVRHWDGRFSVANCGVSFKPGGTPSAPRPRLAPARAAPNPNLHFTRVRSVGLRRPGRRSGDCAAGCAAHRSGVSNRASQNLSSICRLGHLGANSSQMASHPGLSPDHGMR
jgi:hypothetical protein